jgi:histidinol-phosphate/aromatic aminotransferase/cobyric acid decarboxylase-like protein
MTMPAPGAHGGDAARLAREMGVPVDFLLDLSASLNPVAPDIAARARSYLGALRRYPDVAEARRVLAQAIGIEPECLLVTNGGAEAISLLGHLLGGRVEEPEFSLHPRGTSTAPRWRSNPHNPTGRLAGSGERADVWDEAFFPMATGRWTRGDTSALAVVGSLTKLFACPGLRLGYAIADPELIRRVERSQPEWAVGGLEVALLPELVAAADLMGWAKEIAALREDLTELLTRHRLSPSPSDANFVLCDAPAGFRDKLLAQGIVVRDCASFGMPHHVRMAVPDGAGMDRLSTALDVLANDNHLNA